MKRILLIVALSASFNVHAMRKTFKIWTSHIHDNSIPSLNLDVERFKVHQVPAGTYRLITNAGVTNKYVKFPVDGAVQQTWFNFTCLYIKNNENKLDKIGCFDTEKVMDPSSIHMR